MGFPVTELSPDQVMLFDERIFVVFALVPPPEVFTNVNRLMSKFEYQALPLSAPFDPTHGDTSIENRAFGRLPLSALTSSVIFDPACAALQGALWVLTVY